MPKRHRVKDGECVLSVAASYGLPWETIWMHGDNSSLRSLREHHTLYAGDVLAIPDKTIQQVSANTDAKHKFRLKGVPVKVQVQIKRDDIPRANVPFRIEIDGVQQSGQTDSNGVIEAPINPAAQAGRLYVGPPEDEEVYDFALGTVDPADTESGARGRLFNLGYDNSLPFGDLLREFQEKEGLQLSGQLDESTQSKLKSVFGV